MLCYTYIACIVFCIVYSAGCIVMSVCCIVFPKGSEYLSWKIRMENSMGALSAWISIISVDGFAMYF
jgi:hypothetical protein